MSTPKHTPGPYRMLDRKHWSASIGIVSDAKKSLIPVGWVSRVANGGDDEAVAVGHLFCAAPDMLDEHKRTLGQLERMQSMTSHLAKTDPLAEEIASAIKGTKAIIARAEGGE